VRTHIAVELVVKPMLILLLAEKLEAFDLVAILWAESVRPTIVAIRSEQFSTPFRHQNETLVIGVLHERDLLLSIAP
jgi:hypothetical protein